MSEMVKSRYLRWVVLMAMDAVLLLLAGFLASWVVFPNTAIQF